MGTGRGGNVGATVLGVDGENGESDASSSTGVIEIVSIDADEAAALGCLTISTLPPGKLDASLLLVLMVRWPNNR